MRQTIKITARLFFTGCLLSTFALADPIVFLFSGTGSGSLGSVAFTDEAFAFTFMSDTSLLTVPPCCTGDMSTPKGTAATFMISGVGSGSLTGTQAVFVNQAENDVGIWFFNQPDFLTLGNFAFASYNLASNMGPITGTASALSELLPTSVGNHELISLSHASDVTFFAQVGADSPVPEPSTAGMLGVVLCWLAAGRAMRRLPSKLS